MGKRTKELSKNTVIITIGKVSTQFITFLLLPLYTAVLSTEEYGTVDLIMTLVQLLLPLVSVMLDQGAFRFLLTCNNNNERRKIISTSFDLLSISNGVVLLLSLAVMPLIKNQYLIWVTLILIVTSYSNLFLQIARGLKHTNDYAMGSFVCSCSIIVLNILCIVSLHMGANGMLVASFLGNLICCIFLFIKLKLVRYIRIFLFDCRVAKEELRYSSPLVPNQLSLWVMNSSDRIIVSMFMGAAVNGVLAVSHKFPAIYMTFFSIFQLAWHETGAVHFFDKDRDEFFTKIFDQVITIFLSMCVGIISVLPLVFGWFVNDAYAEAYNNIPIYMIAFLFNIVIGLLGVVYVATKRTGEIAKTTFVAAVLNIVINVSLIKYIGLYAASISTLLGYFVTMIYRIRDTKKYLKIRYNKKTLLQFGVLLAVYVVIYYIDNLYLSLVGLTALIPVLLWFNKGFIAGFVEILKGKCVKD